MAVMMVDCWADQMDIKSGEMVDRLAASMVDYWAGNLVATLG